MNTKNKNNMKRHLHFYQLLLTIGLLVYATDLCANDSYVHEYIDGIGYKLPVGGINLVRT